MNMGIMMSTPNSKNRTLFGHGAEDTLELCRIFKDIDVLDRFRLDSGGLDECFLRTPEAKALVGFAKSVWDEAPAQA